MAEGVGDFGNDGMIWGPCRLLTGPCNLVYRLRACKHFEMGLDIQIPFATFLFDAPCPWLSPPHVLGFLPSALLSVHMGLKTHTNKTECFSSTNGAPATVGHPADVSNS